MAMGTMRTSTVLVAVQVVFMCVGVGSRIPDLGIIQSWANVLDTELKTFLDQASGISELQKV
ncbi:hypothetical protein NP493_238g03018 [Ridgeia piscesae]|uniref:Uncharacterized protein n=1 Tax=Ridgeia piscesae TaxID=27915 RepID=A0AAD9UDK9_RIDPI|nr:hypothetical protein NP493_238g03018 [Ridgeia piscesae]